MSMLGILFDSEKLGDIFYGSVAYQIFFDALDTRQLAGCTLYSGDIINATIQGNANVYCIAVASADETKIDLLRNAFWAYRAKGLLPLPMRFLENDQVRQEPLISHGLIGPTGKPIHDSTDWITEAWKKSQEKHNTDKK